MTPRIFIGGTGRSGTTFLHRTIGLHPKIYSFRDELRFIIDPFGLMNLIDSLTTNFSPSQGGRALIEFEKLLLIHLNNPKSSPYPWNNLSAYLGGGDFEEIIREFIQQLSYGNFVGRAAWLKDEGYRGIPKIKRRINNKVEIFSEVSLKKSNIPIPRYFEDRQELLKICSGFLEELFLPILTSESKITWCEKTAYNALHISSLRELFPSSIFIHIKRDPRAVVSSYTKQPWAPTNLEESSYMLKSVINKIINEKDKHKQYWGSNYLEIKLEDFVLNPESILFDKLKSICGLTEDFPIPTDIDVERVARPLMKMPKSDLERINTILKDEILKMNYDL